MNTLYITYLLSSSDFNNVVGCLFQWRGEIIIIEKYSKYSDPNPDQILWDYFGQSLCSGPAGENNRDQRDGNHGPSDRHIHFLNFLTRPHLG